ncbi:MAG: hypothetical protein IPN17_02285 [Deltaproteobacteria bacterium]|nr:hypothetical protein [Deltaproteobacteria bacterium]
MIDRRPVLLCSALLAGCVVDAELESQTSGIAVAGPWQPAASTRAIAATQHVTVVEPPAVSPLGRCTSTNAFACSCTHPACTPAHPGTRDLNTFLLRRYAFLRAGGTYCCRQNSATTRVPTLSVHATGRAIDLMVPMVGGDADNTLGDQAANWLVENAEYIGIQRVVWDRAYWNGERGFGLLASASLSHTNHIHVELSVAGAARQTPFFTSGASMSTTCTARCDGTRLIRTDCTSVDCASTGAPCLAGPPPSCGSPPPAEPAEARLVPGAALPAVAAAAAPGRFTFVGPARLFDTRTPEGSARLVRSGAAGPLTPGSSATFRDWSSLGLPPGATGVWLNVATIGVDAPGYATAFSAGQPRPPTSTVNYVAGAANANATPVVLGASAGVTFEALNSAHMITDAYGAFSPSGAGLVPSGPTRVLDTRSDVALASNTPRAIDVRAPAGAVGVVASITAIAGPGGGFVTAFPCGAPTPPTSNINVSPGAVATNTVVSMLGLGGQLCLLSNVETHAVVDVTGFFAPSSGLTYTALSPQRLLRARLRDGLPVRHPGARNLLAHLPGRDGGGLSHRVDPRLRLALRVQQRAHAPHRRRARRMDRRPDHASRSPDSPDDGDDVAPDAGIALVDAGPPPTDAGDPVATADASVDVDVVGEDAATDAPVLTGGCGCRAGGERPPGVSLSLGAMLAIASLARRRRPTAAISRRSSLPG